MADPIKHVVLLMLENHSFDQMLGALQEGYPDLDGVLPNAPPGVNLDMTGKPITQIETRGKQMHLDPKHEVENVAEQMQDANGSFVKNFQKKYGPKATEDVAAIMSYYPLDFLPALHGLAREFTVCDRWYSSLPGPTWPNRVF